MAKKITRSSGTGKDPGRAKEPEFDQPPCGQVRTATSRGPSEQAAKAAAKALAAQYQCTKDGCKTRTEWVSNITDNLGSNPRWQATVSVLCSA